MSPPIQITEEIVAKIHEAPPRFALAITGGGSSALSALLSVAGASNSVLEGQIPYSSASLEHYLGFSPIKACSAETARSMAMQAFEKAKTQTTLKQARGLGCTAAIQTDRNRKGQDVCYVAIQSAAATSVFTLHLDRSCTRQQQEEACKNLILLAMTKSCDIKCDLPVDHYQYEKIEGLDSWQELQAGKILDTSDLKPKLIFPGAFNPPHEGHQKIAAISEQKTNHKLYYEISISNVDKPSIDYYDMQQRKEMLKTKQLIFTRAATFIEKSALFPGAIFVVGVDTLIRISDLKYYQNQTRLLQQAIASLINNNHRFLVFGRKMRDGYLCLSDLEIDPKLKSICDEISEDEFREDVSSSHIRSTS